MLVPSWRATVLERHDLRSCSPLVSTFALRGHCEPCGACFWLPASGALFRREPQRAARDGAVQAPRRRCRPGRRAGAGARRRWSSSRLDRRPARLPSLLCLLLLCLLLLLLLCLRQVAAAAAAEAAARYRQSAVPGGPRRAECRTRGWRPGLSSSTSGKRCPCWRRRRRNERRRR